MAEYNYFINDTANLDLGIGAEIEPITGLSAEEAVAKYKSLTEEGFSPYIGLNIPGDIVFDDKYGEGTSIFNEKESGISSFYFGDNFVKELKENNEHAQNVISAYKELWEKAEKILPNTEKPEFLFEKEKELNMKNEENNNNHEKMSIYSFSPFGYEGSLVAIETDLRQGLPTVDIVGLADGSVKESRERMISAIKNSGLEFPQERVLISLSPADLKKEGTGFDLPIALSVLSHSKNYPSDEPVLAIGELELSGKLRAVRGAAAAVNTAKAAGITKIICDPTTAELIKDIDGIKICQAKNLEELNEKLENHEHLKEELFVPTKPRHTENKIHFTDDPYIMDSVKDLDMKGHFETIRAIEIAAAGKHNILAVGAPGCGKTMLMQALLPALTPDLTEEEAQAPKRIKSLAGLDSPNTDNLRPPFRTPHQTSSIEGICGGGPNVRPGEMSLAHNGILFLDKAAEFKTSVLQMMRVPLENKTITISRAGRTTIYPTDFQLAMATNPCPCGCMGTKDKVCLDSAQSIDLYWKKFSGPLLDRVEIKQFVEKNENDTREMSLEEMRGQVAKAIEIQRERGVYNGKMTPEQVKQYCKLDKEEQAFLDNHVESNGLSEREKSNLLKLSLTVANMEGRDYIKMDDLKEARELSSRIFEKPHEYAYEPPKKISLDEKKNQLNEKETEISKKEQKAKKVEEQVEQFSKNTKKASESIKNGKANMELAEMFRGLSEDQVNEAKKQLSAICEQMRLENSQARSNEQKNDKQKDTGHKENR